MHQNSSASSRNRSGTHDPDVRNGVGQIPRHEEPTNERARFKINGRLHPDTVARTLKPYITELLATDATPYSGQSLRAGFVTEARTNGIGDTLIARHTVPGRRHANTLDIYDRPSQLFERSPFTGWY